MIEYLEGTVLARRPGHIVVLAGGVGHGVDVPSRADTIYPAPGESIALHTYLYVQEAVLRLYGFLSEEERDIFEVFIGTKGIGPRTALDILSAIEIGRFAQAIMREEISTLTKIPGIGKKTAERLVLELRDKVGAFVGTGGETTTGPGRHRGQPAGLRETIEALEALGCKPPVAERAALKAWEVLGPQAATEDLIREALKHRF